MRARGSFPPDGTLVESNANVPCTVTREQIYQEIWSEPVHTVAARYGISDVGLAKVCRRHRIPLPGRGYWQQLRAGQRLWRQPLPPLRTGDRDKVTIARSRSQVHEERALELVRYRNDLAHDSPQLHLATGGTRPAFWSGRSCSAFESLDESQRPVRLKHVVAAVRAHDSLVQHVIGTAKLFGWPDAMKKVGGASCAITEPASRSGWWRTIRELLRAWEAGPQRRQASLAELVDARADFMRRMRVKLHS